MNLKLRIRAAKHGGVFSHADVLACGYTESQLRERLKARVWTRLRQGYYAQTPDLDALPPWDRDAATHRLAVRAAARTLGTSVVVSHQSAAVLYGLPLWGSTATEVQVTRRATRTGRVRAGIRYHLGRLPEESVTAVDGIAVTTPARALVELACVTSYETAVVAMDAGLRQGLASRNDLRAALQTMNGWPGSGTARAAVAFADGRSESVGESRLRVLLDNHGLPEPVLQARFGTSFDNIVARVDFYLRAHGVVIEFDGLVKYREEAASTVIAEKQREDQLREMGLIVVRVTWDELDDPETLVRRIMQAIDRACPTAARGA
jgi:very-short-patch-repair endonuclease